VVHDIVLVALRQHEMIVMIGVRGLGGEAAEVRTYEVEEPKCRIPSRRPALAVAGLTDLTGMGVGGVVGDVEPETPRLADPHGRVRNEQPLPAEEVIRQRQFRRAHREGERVHQAEHPCVVVPRGEFLLHPVETDAEERERLLDPVHDRAVRVAGHIAVLVMTPVLRRPPYRSALVGGAPEQVEEEACGPAALERRVRRVAVEAHRHADADPPYRDEERERDGRRRAARGQRRGDYDQRREVDGYGHEAEEGTFALRESGDELHGEGGEKYFRRREGRMERRRRGRRDEYEGWDRDVQAHAEHVDVESAPDVPWPVIGRYLRDADKLVSFRGSGFR